MSFIQFFTVLMLKFAWSMWNLHLMNVHIPDGKLSDRKLYNNHNMSFIQFLTAWSMWNLHLMKVHITDDNLLDRKIHINHLNVYYNWSLTQNKFIFLHPLIPKNKYGSINMKETNLNNGKWIGWWCHLDVKIISIQDLQGRNPQPY